MGVTLRGRARGGAEEPCGAGSALGQQASRWALSGTSPELSLAVGGERTGLYPPLPVVLVPHSQPSPGQPGVRFGALRGSRVRMP